MSIKHRLKARNEILLAENASLRARCDKLEQANFDLAVSAEVLAMRRHDDAIERLNRESDKLRRIAQDLIHRSDDRIARADRILDSIDRDQGDWWQRGDAPPWEGS